MHIKIWYKGNKYCIFFGKYTLTESPSYYIKFYPKLSRKTPIHQCCDSGILNKILNVSPKCYNCLTLDPLNADPTKWSNTFKQFV